VSKDGSSESAPAAASALDAMATRMLGNIARAQETQLRILNSMPANMLGNIARAQETQLRILNSMPANMLGNIARAQETQLRILNSMPANMLGNIARAQETQLRATAVMPRINFGFVTETYLSHIDEALQVIASANTLRIEKEDLNSHVEIKPGRKLSNREVAAWLTVISFLIVYISYATAISYSSSVAKISATDGPSPFDAAMAVGGLVFWIYMNRPGGSSDE
jgi:hypothetical protein